MQGDVSRIRAVVEKVRRRWHQWWLRRHLEGTRRHLFAMTGERPKGMVVVESIPTDEPLALYPGEMRCPSRWRVN